MVSVAASDREAPRRAPPRRHGADLAEGQRIAGLVARLIRDRDPTPTPEQWRALGEALWDGDPPADALAAWMAEVGMGRAMPLLERALAQGLAKVPDAPQPLREFMSVIERRPWWVDERLLREGALASHLGGLTGMRTLRDLGLMAGYLASAINRTLILTGALQRGAQRRLAETTKWWLDCTAVGGMARFGEGFRSTVRVRVLHALMRRRVGAMPEWDRERFGLPVNQSDMHATYLAFSVIFLFGQRLMGIPITRREAAAVMHLWRYIGWLMGVEERWLCFGEMAGRVALYQNLLTQAPPDESSRQLGRALGEEPLSRHYRRWPKLQGRFNRAMHLSICKAFLGERAMLDLGLPAHVLPWYPLLKAPQQALRHSVHRLLPGGRARLIRTGRAEQVAYLRVLFGDQQPDLARPHG